MSDEEDRTSDPSPRRIQMAREMGFLPMAHALVQAAALFASIGLVYFRGPALANALHGSIDETWARLPEIAHGTITARSLRGMVLDSFMPVLEPLLTICCGTLVIMLVVHQATTGGSWTPALALPNFDRLMKSSLFADEGGSSNKPPIAHRILLGILRPLAIFAGCALVVLVLRSRWSPVPTSDDHSHDALRGVLQHGRVSLGLGLATLTLPLICLGAVEYALNRVHWFDRLRPSSDEARRETREIEGDVESKRRRQKLVRQIRQTAAIDALVADTAAVVVGTGFSGLSVQLVRGRNGRLAVGQVIRGSMAASYAEKASAKGRPWIRDGKLAARLAGLSGKPHDPPGELPVVLDLEIQRRIAKGARQADPHRQA